MAFAMAMVIAGAAGAFYILFGYPILLAFLPFKKAPAVRKDLNHEATVTLIMAVYNGAAHIRQKLETILALDYPRHLIEIIVVSRRVNRPDGIDGCRILRSRGPINSRSHTREKQPL